MQRVTASLIAAGLLAVSGTAFADGDDASGTPAPAAAPIPDMAPAPVPAGMDQNDRPLVAPKGAFEVHGVLPIFDATVTVVDPTTGAESSSSSTDVSLAVGFTYGAIDKLEVGVDYAHGLSPSDGNGTLNAHAAFAALHNDKLDVGLAADISLDLDSGGSDIIAVGAWARYHVAPKISIFTGNPGLPHTTLLGGSIFNGEYQLEFGLNNGNPVLLTLPVGVGLQATPEIYAFVSTTVAGFALSGGGSSEYIFSDFIPFNIGALYQVNPKLDVGAEFSDDLKNAGDFYSIAFVGRYWIK